MFNYDLTDLKIRKKILQNNIYGVDLDQRAVEIAKLNLMIKALEKIKQEDLIGKKLLPNLKLNIRSGNSLISGLQNENNALDFYKNNESDIHIFI